ncbi:MAG TPA: hypothetical protein VFL57_07675 [Bryobacteraceae bacterium]|nr:hypothetical protein [Bryobacteraceae bacterium]
MDAEGGGASGTAPVRREEAQPRPEPKLVPKGVAWSMGAGLLGLVVGGAIVGFTAAVIAPAVRERLRRFRDQRLNRPEKT